LHDVCVIDHVYMYGRSNENTNFRFNHIAQIKIQLSMYQTRMEVQYKLKKIVHMDEMCIG
jgi:hypothetical protein